jgi:hypothetical protein
LRSLRRPRGLGRRTISSGAMRGFLAIVATAGVAGFGVRFEGFVAA